MKNRRNHYLWAQALDNASVDHAKLGDRLLAPHEHEKRSEVMSYIQNVRFDGKEILEEQAEWDGVRIAVHDDKYAVEVECVERDVQNRISVIVCAGYYDSPFDMKEYEGIEENLLSFAREISRTVSDDMLIKMKKAFERLRDGGIRDQTRKTTIRFTATVILVELARRLIKHIIRSRSKDVVM